MKTKILSLHFIIASISCLHPSEVTAVKARHSPILALPLEFHHFYQRDL